MFGSLLSKLTSYAGRTWVYAVSLAAIPLFVAANKIPADDAPLWVTLVGAILLGGAPVMALTHRTPDPEYMPGVDIEPRDDELDAETAASLVDPQEG